MGDRGKLLLKLALEKNKESRNIWKKFEPGKEKIEPVGREVEPDKENIDPREERIEFENENVEPIATSSGYLQLQLLPIKNKTSDVDSEKGLFEQSYADNEMNYTRSFPQLSSQTIVPTNQNNSDLDSETSSSSSSDSETPSENVTTGESDYSPSTESSSSSNSQVPLSIVTKNRDVVTEINEGRKPKKRKADKSTWKKNVAKRLKDQGKAYLSATTNKEVKKREMGTPCNEACRLKCHTKFSIEYRKQIFDEYWALGDANKQRDFISFCTVSIKPKYQYHIHENKRRDNNAFHLMLNDTRIRVCKTFFKSTLGITDRPIRTVIEKRTEVGILENDRRGKHKNHRKLDKSIREGIILHINSIPRIESHYTRQRNDNREYIEGGKSLADLYRDYVKECEQKNVSYGKYQIYHQVFTTQFNISFYTPKKDQCTLCISYANASEAQKEELSSQYENHILEKDLSRLEKNTDKEKIGNNYIVAVFDLQAVLQCPRGDVSHFYYKSKLNVFNFTVYEMKGNAKMDEVFCYIWDETHGKRGANEIGSCLLRYLEKISNESENTDLEIVFYSDNCAGQQKNKFIISMFIYAVQIYKNIKSICHKFLIAGHTQNEGDCAHSVIERQVKRYLKASPIYVPNQYVTLIRSAKKTGKPFQVNELSYKDFLDLKGLNSKIGNFIGEEKLSDMKMIKIEKENPFTVLYKTSYSQAEFSEMSLKSLRGKNKSIITMIIDPAYKSRIKINDHKRSDIRELFKKAAIPSYYADYYNTIEDL